MAALAHDWKKLEYCNKLSQSVFPYLCTNWFNQHLGTKNAVYVDCSSFRLVHAENGQMIRRSAVVIKDQ